MSDSAEGSAPTSFSQAHDHLLARADIQFSFPAYKPPAAPAWLLAIENYIEHHWLAFKWGLWIVAGLILVFVIYSFAPDYWPAVERLFHRNPMASSVVHSE